MIKTTTKATAIAAALAVIANCILYSNAQSVDITSAQPYVPVNTLQTTTLEKSTGGSSGEIVGVNWGEETFNAYALREVDIPLADMPPIFAEEEREQWYSDEYLTNNLAIKEYADKYATFTFNGVVFDGLAVMAQANTESDYMSDKTQTLTALYPSVFVPLTDVSDIESLSCVDVWGNATNLNGAKLKINRYYTQTGLVAWSTGDGVNEQGPLQTRISNSAATVLLANGCTSEYAKVGNAASLNNSLYGYQASVYMTGSNHNTKYNTTGDRWAIKDNCLIYKTDKLNQLNRLWDNYYKDCGYIPNKYEYLAILAYSHWIPSVINGDLSVASARYYGFAKENAWYEISHQLSTEEALEVIRSHVYADIDENRDLFYSGEYTKEEAMAMFEPVLHAGSTRYAHRSEPWQIFNELVDKGIVDPSLVIVNPEYGYQHAMKYAIQYLYAYEMLDILLMEGY